MKYRLLKPSLDDLHHIDATVTDRFGIAVADRVSAELFSLFELLADHQGMGIVRTDIIEGPFRFFIHGPNWIIYEPGDPMVVHRVYPAARDLQNYRPGS